MSTNDRAHDATDHTLGPDLCAHLTTADNGTTECTLYPAEAPVELQTTAWISAAEGSFVDLVSKR